MKNIVKLFSEKKILVIGDYMLDQYTIGEVHRRSPEAPVLVLENTKEVYLAGGAGNVAMNLASLDAKVIALGVIGKDKEGRILKKLLKNRSINIDGIITDQTRQTTTKNRIVAEQQLLRIDHEDKHDIAGQYYDKIVSFFSEQCKSIDGIIIADYAKGCLTYELARLIVNASKVPVIVDTKPAHKGFYRGISVLKVNKQEALEMTGEKQLDNAGRSLEMELSCKVVISRGSEGVTVYEHNQEPLTIESDVHHVYDVTGAGDTLGAVLCLGVVCGLSLHDASSLANYAAGIVVQKKGTSIITKEELSQFKE